MTGQLVPDGGDDRNSSGIPRQLTYTIADDEQPSETVLRAVGAVTNTEPFELDPLYEVVDPTHLDGLIESLSDGGGTVRVSLVFNECSVTITDATVRVSILDADTFD